MFNQLSEAQLERLSILSEECGEVIQAVGKILRHGYGSYNPDDRTHIGNSHDLEKELGDLKFAVSLMVKTGDVDPGTMDAYARNKATRIERWLHCEENKVL